MGLKENVAGIWLFKACLGKRDVAVACNSATIRVLGCLETPPAFLEAVPIAWTVNRGEIDALRTSTVTSSVPPPARFGPNGPDVRLPGKRSAKWEVVENVAGIWLFKACWKKRYVALACNSASIRVLGCPETPSAFLEAVPSAWTVTRGVVVALRVSTVTSSVPRNASGVSRGCAKWCMDGNSG